MNEATTTITLADGTVLPDCRQDLLNVADLMARGWSIIPLKPRSKVPAVEWKQFQHRLATFEELEAWFATPGYNIGIVTGKPSGIFVIDADSPEAISWALRNLPPCNLRVRTAKGLHLYYPFSGDVRLLNKTRLKVDGRTLELDVRAQGAYIVGPGSIHPSGHIYTREGEGWRWS